jgi:hypothetical protein
MTSAPEEIATTPAPSAETEKEYAKLNEAQWAEAEALYETGVLNGAQVCEKFGIKVATWKMRLYRAKAAGKPIVKGSKIGKVKEELEKAAVEGNVSAATKFAREKRERIDNFKEKAYVAGNAMDTLAKRILRDFVAPTAGATAPVKPADKHPDIKALRDLGRVMRENYRWVMNDVLEAGDEVNEEDLPQLSFRNLSEEDLETIRRGNEDDEDDLENLPDSTETEDEIVEEAPAETEK